MAQAHDTISSLSRFHLNRIIHDSIIFPFPEDQPAVPRYKRSSTTQLYHFQDFLHTLIICHARMRALSSVHPGI